MSSRVGGEKTGPARPGKTIAKQSVGGRVEWVNDCGAIGGWAGVKDNGFDHPTDLSGHECD